MYRFKYSQVALIVISSLTSQHVLANSSPATSPENSDEIERIVIRGTKQNLTLQEVDSSVELFNSDRLDAEHIIDLNDALVRIPNVTGDGSNDGVAIRGIGRNGTSSVGQGVTSNIYIDGAPLSGVALSRGLSSLWDVEQVEVLRGSQSSVQGRNALAGAIVISTADPSYTPEGKFRVNYGEDNTYQVAGAFGNAIIDDQLAFRLAVDYQETDGFIEHIYTDKNADFEERYMIRGKLLWEPKAIDDLTVKLTLDHNNTDTGESRKVVTTNYGVNDPRFVNFDPFDYQSSGYYTQNDTESTRTLVDIHYDISEHWQFNTILTHEDTDVTRQFGLQENIADFGVFANNDFEETVKSAEIRLNFDYGQLSGVIGGYYYDSKNNNHLLNQALLAPQISAGTQGLGSVTPNDSVVLLTQQFDDKTKNYSLFTQIRYELNDQWTLDLGLRYDDEEYENTGVYNTQVSVQPDNCLATVPGALIGQPLPSISLPCSLVVSQFLGSDPDQPLAKASYDAWLPKVNLTYQITPEHSVFISAQRGYRAGGSYLTKQASSNGSGNVLVADDYDPEYLTTYEVGSRSILAGGDITLNTNVFYSKYKDQLIRLPGQNVNDYDDDVIINAAESTIWGAEVMFDYAISQEWHTYTSLGYLNTEFDDFPYANQGEFANLAGNKQSASPEFSASVGVNWNHSEGWFANISAYYSSSSYSEVTNLSNSDLRQPALDEGIAPSVANKLEEKTDAYAQVNGRFGYEFEDFVIYIYGTNLFDKEVVTRVFLADVDQGSGQISFNNSATATTLLPGRALGIGLDYRF